MKECSVILQTFSRLAWNNSSTTSGKLIEQQVTHKKIKIVKLPCHSVQLFWLYQNIEFHQTHLSSSLSPFKSWSVCYTNWQTSQIPATQIVCFSLVSLSYFCVCVWLMLTFKKKRKEKTNIPCLRAVCISLLN